MKDVTVLNDLRDYLFSFLLLAFATHLSASQPQAYINESKAPDKVVFLTTS